MRVYNTLNDMHNFVSMLYPLDIALKPLKNTNRDQFTFSIDVFKPAITGTLIGTRSLTYFY